ncbi:hypothetical protein [Sporosarcina obsidiansis]|uniref:hypothetical protein n=1 Tax=Sporosarcina obsidiansis TaxID=2660748 RepID=UPI00129BE184|nr:hypothetical protein [Sporosarcina obsidiansis]
MNPGELIMYLLIGMALAVVILLNWLILRKRKKLAITLTGLLVIGYVGSYLYYPTLKTNTHANRYEQVIEYLSETYPNREFQISPKHYENGISVGEFDVNDRNTPTMGVTLRVDKKGQVTQTATWSNRGYPTQQELWREVEFIHGDPYSLDKENAHITKDDVWIKGELTVFALTINDTPAIAVFNYSKEGYGLLQLEQGEHEGFIVVEEAGYVFIYTDERYPKESITADLENGKNVSFNVAKQKGRLVVETPQ